MSQNRIFKVGGNSEYTPLGVKKDGSYTMTLPMQEAIWERSIRNDIRGSDEDQEFLNKVDDAKELVPVGAKYIGSAEYYFYTKIRNRK